MRTRVAVVDNEVVSYGKIDRQGRMETRQPGAKAVYLNEVTQKAVMTQDVDVGEAVDQINQDVDVGEAVEQEYLN